jgi:hypothetical protein
MTAVILKKPELPKAVKEKLENLESRFFNGEVTVKGYCKQKWKILEPHAPSSVTEQIESLQKKLKSTKLSETEYYNQMMKCLEYGFYLTELEEEKIGDESVRSTKNDKSDGQLSEIENVNGKINTKGNGTNNSSESEKDNGRCDEEATNGSYSSGKDVKEEGKQKKNLDLKMLTRSKHSSCLVQIHSHVHHWDQRRFLVKMLKMASVCPQVHHDLRRVLHRMAVNR